MTNEMKLQIQQYLGKLLMTIEKGAGWAADQIPLIVQEKLTYDFVQAVVWCVLALLFPVVVWSARATYLKSTVFTGLTARKNYGFDQVDARVLTACVSTFFTIVPTLAIFLTNLNTALKIYFAPRLYIIDWLLSMNK